MSLHEIMIILHATAAVLCFAFGVLTLFPRRPRHSRLNLFNYYFILLIAMIVFLAGAILAHVNQPDAMPRGIFAGLFVLSLYMLLRGFWARTALFSQRDDWMTGYIDHIGFTLIALFEGFVIVAGIDLGAPVWLTAAVAVLGVIAGNRVLHNLQTRASHPHSAES
jgi:hypothetical protein